MPRSQTEPLPDLPQCGKQSKFGSVFCINLPDLSSNCIILCSLPPHYINSKFIETGGEKLITILLTSEKILEVIRYEFNVKGLLFTPKHVVPPQQQKQTQRDIWNVVH